MDTKSYIAKIAAKNVNVGVVGLGYVGLPLSLAFVRANVHVTGFDIDKRKVISLLEGKSYIHHIPNSEIVAAMKGHNFLATGNFNNVSACDAIIICVPTPLNRNREPDMSYILGTAASIAPHLKHGQLVILESTTWPGTTVELLLPALEEPSGLKAGEDFYLAFSPEREDPGNLEFSTTQIPKIVGGHTSEATAIAKALYKLIMQKVVAVSSTQVAEMAKLLENIFRSVNIALVNELKVLCHAMDIDVWEVVNAAATKPFGFMPFYPGPGLGGHCIPIDPFYLTWKAREFDQPTRFIELAGEINVSMHQYVIERLVHGMNAHRKAINGSRIMILGVAYKRDIDDMRESPALAIIELLQKRGAQIAYHDPYVPKLMASRNYNLGLKSLELTEETAKHFDACLIVTDHTCFDYQAICDWFPLVVDCRNATKDVKRGKEKVLSA